MREKKRRFAVVVFVFLALFGGIAYEALQTEPPAPPPPVLGINQSLTPSTATDINSLPFARDALNTIEEKGRAPKTGYKRALFGDGWANAGQCDVRNVVLKRDLTETVTKSDTDCTVLSGTLNDPYTGKTIAFQRGEQTSDDVQIDHVVALSDAWQKGAQALTNEERVQFANDNLNLLAVDGPINQQKGDGDAATRLPPNKDFRCRYVARQIAVKQKYRLWVTQAEKEAMARVLSSCPDQRLPLVS